MRWKSLFIALLTALAACSSLDEQYGYDPSKNHPPPSTGAHASQGFAPWPPPAPSDRYIFPASAFSDRKKFRTYSDLNLYFQDRLQRGGYNAFSYFRAPGGFVMTTRVEAINIDGAPRAWRRWSPEVTSVQGQWPYRLFQGITSDKEGYYRLLAIFVTTDVSGPDESKPVDLALMKRWLNGATGLFPDLIDKPIPKHEVYYIYLYELHQQEGKQAEQITPAADISEQLRRTGVIWSFER